MKEDDGPWVCLPSKHHPKEVYYFNVLTGVSTWEKPENLCESSETPTASASSSAQSEHAGYVIESLSPKSSPKRQRHDGRTAAASESNEKKNSRFCEGGNSFRALKNRHIVRDFPYKVNDRSTKSNEYFDPQVSKCKERNDVVAIYCPPSRPSNQDSRRMESRFISNPISLPSGISSYHKNKSTSLVKTYSSKLSSSVSSAPVVYGSASLRLENLKNKLAKERSQDPQSDLHDQRGIEKSLSIFKERRSSSIGSRNQSRPYVPYISSLRTQSAPSSSSFSRQLKDNTYRKSVRETGFSATSLPSSSGNIHKTSALTLDDKYKRIGFTKEYNHTSSTIVEIEPTESSTGKSFEYVLPSSSYLTKGTSSEVIPFLSRRDSLYRETTPDLSSKILCKFDRPTILRDRIAVPVSKTNAFISSGYENPPLNDVCKTKNLVENKVNIVEFRNSTSSLNLSKTPATDRLINLRAQLQARNIPVNSIHSQENHVQVSKGGSWSGTAHSGNSSLSKSAEGTHLNFSSCSDNDNQSDQNSWKWDSQIIVHDYNHKSVEQSCERTPTFSHSALSKNSFSEIDKIKGSTSESSVPRRISWDGNPESRLQPYCLAPGDKGFGPESEIVHLTKTTKNTPLDYRSKVDSIPNSYSSETSSFEFIKPNQDTLLKLRKGSKKKIQESKGGITKISRGVQKQIRSVSCMLKKVPSSIVHKKMASKITQENEVSQPRKLSENETDFDEMMDWEPIEPEKVVLHVEELRRDGSLQTPVNSELSSLCNMEAPTSSKWFIVLDTNVLLSHLAFLEYLRDIKDYENGMPILYIPWIVLQELDGLKSSNRNPSLKYYARAAVRFLQENLSSRHPRICGQPKIVSEKERLADDSILQCSLDLVKKSYNVLLLTNDRNLYNKAVVSGVLCCSAARLHEDLENRRKTFLSHVSDPSDMKNLNDRGHEEKINFIFCQIKDSVKAVLEEVLKTEMILAYDRTWLAVVARKPPWTLNDVMFCVSKHWISVFGLIFPSTARALLEQIQASFRVCYQHSLADVHMLLNTCESLISLISSLSYKQLADKALITLQEMRQALEQLSTKSEDKPSSATSPSEILCQKSSSQHNKSSDSGSQSSASDRSRKKSNSSDMESECDTGSESGVHRGNANDSDGDCISLVASSFCDNVLNKQLSEAAVKEGQETVHSYLNKIWGKVAVFCGMLSDLMGVEPCVSYEPPDPLPSTEILHQNMLYFVKCVSGLLRCVERVLSYPAGEMFENHPAILNFCSFIRDSFPALSHQETKSLPYYIYIYCTRSDTRQQLENGRKQFEQFEAVLNDAVTFFMKQNHSGPTVTPLM